ncbi:MAG: DUF5063 domain-containing protein [Bacteroidales bacterium]|nr:DUF5063 domain-containing protein [Bacteroidales bacterium]
MQKEENYLYAPAVLDFITVSTEYCKYLEQCQSVTAEEFCRVMRGLLPMLYLKMTWMEPVPEVAGWNTPKLTEDDYNFVRSSIAAVLGEKDDFLEVFVEDFKYSEQPVLCTISENLTDIYQQLRELAATFSEGYEEAMQVALYETSEEFKLQWGQKLLNALRALHDVAMQD